MTQTTSTCNYCQGDWDCDYECQCESTACVCDATPPFDPCSWCDYADGQICDTSQGSGTCVWEADPIIVDLDGAGFPLTDVRNGVKFDFFGKGAVRLSWIAKGADVGWLALDRNGNGRISNGAELFSNVTPQPDPKPMAKIGFRALAVYDQRANGGNGDGWIDNKDAVYSQLRIWVDKNHNGVSDPGELLTLKQAGIQAISVHFETSHWTDANGNLFRYRSQVVFDKDKKETGRYVYDVILKVGK